MSIILISCYVTAHSNALNAAILQIGNCIREAFTVYLIFYLYLRLFFRCAAREYLATEVSIEEIGARAAFKDSKRIKRNELEESSLSLCRKS